MAKKPKFYAIWKGHKTGVFSTWEETQKHIAGYPGAQYKSFDSQSEAEDALKKNYWTFTSSGQKKTTSTANVGKPITPSLSVDAACSGNPGVLEYQGVDTATKQVVFKQGPFPQGTVNLGEFLALVHGIAYLKQHNLPYPIYSDSITAIAWVRDKVVKSKLEPNDTNAELFERVDRALEWLKNNRITTKILKWETEHWGENPADYGRK